MCSICLGACVSQQLPVTRSFTQLWKLSLSQLWTLSLSQLWKPSLSLDPALLRQQQKLLFFRNNTPLWSQQHQLPLIKGSQLISPTCWRPMFHGVPFVFATRYPAAAISFPIRRECARETPLTFCSPASLSLSTTGSETIGAPNWAARIWASMVHPQVSS